MPNRMIYVRKDISDNLDKEDNVSGLINELLATHYGKVFKKVGVGSSVSIEKTSMPSMGNSRMFPTEKPKLCPHFQEKGGCMHKDAKKLGCNK